MAHRALFQGIWPEGIRKQLRNRSALYSLAIQITEPDFNIAAGDRRSLENELTAPAARRRCPQSRVCGGCSRATNDRHARDSIQSTRR